MLFSFPGVAVVTGAGGSGIGAAVAKSFASAGCQRIAITDLSPTALEKTREAIAASHQHVSLLAKVGDIAEERFVESFIDDVVGRYGRLDYAVNCAGVLGDAQRSTETTVESFDHINGINYRGCWLSSRAELKQMVSQDPLQSHDSQRGAIVNVASQLGLVGRPNAPAYCSSKAAVIAMTRSDAIDYSGDGIRVNCICPGVIETPMTTGNLSDLGKFTEAANIAPMRRMGKPGEIADAALFLCSTRASFIQGHALVVDRGYTIV